MGERLVCGDLSAEFEDGDLRSIRFRDAELLNRLYFALRDENWRTVPGTMSSSSKSVGPDTVQLRFGYSHLWAGNHFSWEGEVVLNSSGSLEYRWCATVLSGFRKNRIGLCALHPVDCSGEPVEITHSRGAPERSRFPRLVSPHQPFLDVRAMTHFRADGTVLKIEFAGDVFETEDQRNWTDATFKTYSTPLRLPFPVTLESGDALNQSVSMTVARARRPIRRLSGWSAAPGNSRRAGHRETSSSRSDRSSRAVAVALGGLYRTPRRHVPAIGTSVNVDRFQLGADIRKRAIELSQDLGFAHLRAHVDLIFDDFEKRVADSAAFARDAGLPLAMAIRLDDSTQERIPAVLDAVREAGVQVATWSVLSQGEPVTAIRHLHAVRTATERIERRVAVGGGTDAFFAELNRNRPDRRQLDFFMFSVCPQVHAVDSASIVETLSGQRAAVKSVGNIGRGASVFVEPITLEMRWNPYASVPEEPRNGLGPAREVDARQRQPFCAAWTGGSIKALAESGAARATYFDLAALFDVSEVAAQPPAAKQVTDMHAPSTSPVYPVAHVLRYFAGKAAARVLHTGSSRPEVGEALALQEDGGIVMIFLSYADHELQFELSNAKLAGPVRGLTPGTFVDAERGRSGGGRCLALSPYGVAVAPVSR